jgi:hypothetical protein
VGAGTSAGRARVRTAAAGRRGWRRTRSGWKSAGGESSSTATPASWW